MSIPVIVHIVNEDAIAAEVEHLPDPGDQVVIVHNPRLRDGKDLHYLAENVTTMIIPWHRINFVELMPSGDEMEDIITFVREQ